MKPMMLFAACLMLTTLAPSAASAALSPADARYLSSAMQTQLGRYALASLAEKTASSPAVKSLAASIASEASSETKTLDALARKDGVPIPRHPGLRDAYHYSQLSGLHGKTFDRRFVQELKIDDSIVSSGDRQEMRSGRDRQVTAFAKHRYGALQKELKALDRLST